jgi:flagellar basal-body rod protein FlgF
MENAQLISLSRQIALTRQMDVVANNLANINTTGFKAENILFEEYKMPVARDRDFSYSDQTPSYTEDWATIHDMSAGAISATGNDLDVALQGDGFLVVQTPNGERWTKAGALQINSTGILVDQSGLPVLSNGGPIQFGADDGAITIAEDGTIDTAGGGAKGRLRVVEFANPQQLARDGSNLYSGGTPVPAKGTRVVQGAIEKSNVSGVTAMAEMIRVQRAYESLADLMQKQNDLRTSAVKRLGDMTA